MGRAKATFWTEEQDDYLKGVFNQKASYEDIAKDFEARFGVQKKLLHFRNRLLALGIANDIVKSIPARSSVSASVQKPAAFETRPVLSMKKGATAYMPGVGPMRFEGLQPVVLQQGAEIGNLMVLKQVHADSSYTNKGSRPKPPLTVLCAPRQLEGKGMRAISSAGNLEKTLSYLEHGIVGKKLPKMTSKRKIVLDNMLRSDQPQDLADIIIHAFRPLSVEESRSGLDTEMAYKAIHILASEYAQAARKTYDEARYAIESRSGRKTIEQLAREVTYSPEAALS